MTTPDAAEGHGLGVRPARSVRVAVGQLAATLDLDANRALVTAVVAGLAEREPDLVVLPEATMHDFGGAGRDLGAVAEPLDGPFVATVAGAASGAGAVVVAGMFERRTGDGGTSRPYNTVIAVAPDGTLLARYRKLHLYDAFDYRESDRLHPGSDDPPVIDVNGMRVGIMTCYDLRFPETARLLVDGGAEVLLVPAAWVRGEHKVQHWQALLAARAIENAAYVVGAAQAAPRYTGFSAVLDPMGVVLASCAAEPGALTVELDAGEVAAARAVNPSLENRRFRVVRR